ncbi:hypothetical protein OCA00_21325 [Bacillus cereus]|nr:hypothetical protein [Bacillus cereus]MCU4857101.1 hypothetical protein [Bacillus cereus]MCU4873762.1 hypothetical protein [Bacillus cereus]MCU4941100.1 hypothetical protein [Bacillus cereus]
MAIEAHRCNVKGCNGLVVFENADYDLQNPDIIKGVYAFDDPSCNVFGKEFLVVPSYAVIEFDEEKGDFEEIESACITEWQNQKF